MQVPLSSEIHSNLSTKNSEFLLSIVIPTFNRQHELAKLLDQLIVELVGAQGEVEILVSDNNSTDQTSRVLQEYVTSQTDKIAIMCFTQASNVGAILNLHFLINQSRAKYVWAIGDDDALAPGKLHEILKLLRTESVNLLLLRTEGIGEWDRIPRRPIANLGGRLLKVKLCDENSADYLFAGGFLGSVIIRTKTWMDVLPQVEKWHETCYANWAAVLKVASTDGEYFVMDEPCVNGNFNMQGESKIPAFHVLVLGRIRVWAAFNGTPLQKLLREKIKELAFTGWAQIALGKTNDVVTFSEKLRALGMTISLLGFSGGKSYFFALVSVLFPFHNILEKVKTSLKAR